MVVECRKQSTVKVFTRIVSWDGIMVEENAPASETLQVSINMGEIT